MSGSRTTAVVAGVFFIVAALTAIVALALYSPVLNDPGYVLGPGSDAQIFAGAFLEVLLAISVIGTAVTLFPVIRRENEGIALGYVCGRTLEAVIITVGIVSLLAIVTLRRESGAAEAEDAVALTSIARSLVAVHDWTFLMGPGMAIGVNTLLLASVMYTSRLVPRWIAVVGLVGGPLVFVSSTAVLFGLYEQISAFAAIGALPVFAWEMSLAVWLIARGFRPVPLAMG